MVRMLPGVRPRPESFVPPSGPIELDLRCPCPKRQVWAPRYRRGRAPVPDFGFGRLDLPRGVAWISPPRVGGGGKFAHPRCPNIDNVTVQISGTPPRFRTLQVGHGLRWPRAVFLLVLRRRNDHSRPRARVRRRRPLLPSAAPHTPATTPSHEQATFSRTRPGHPDSPRRSSTPHARARRA